MTNNMKNISRFGLNASAASIALGIAFASSPAFAQDKPADAAAAEDSNVIIVTGSRIPQPNLTSASPITVVSTAEIKQQGTTRVEDLINNLPQAFAAQGGNLSNGATGTATVDLRGLGAARTLVLVNGRRLLPGDPRSPFADLNAVPAALVKSVEVLTGGASSTYGADAVSGVVNFKMDTEFEGFKLDGQYSLYQHNNDSGSLVTAPLIARNYPFPRGSSANGGTVDATAVIGAGFDDNRGHVTAYVGYRKIKPVLQATRDYSACNVTANTPAQITARAGRLLNCGGSATSANGTFFTTNATSSNTYQVGPNAANGTGTFIPGSTPYNFAPVNYYQRPDERYTAGFFAHYDVSDAFKPYMEGMFMDDRTVAQIAASGDFGNTTTINCDNPLLSAQQRPLVCNTNNLIGFSATTPATVFTNPDGTTYNRANLTILRRNVEGGGRRDDLQHTSYRLVTGATGDIAKGISYDAFYQFGRTNFAQTYNNDFSVTRLTRALDVISVGGVPTCRSVVDGSDPNCVPYNIFKLGAVTPAALSYLQTPGFSRGQTEETVADASITVLGGEYGVQSPWADNGIGMNVGVEYRKESLNFETDQAFATGDLAGQGGATIGLSGSYNVKEVFGEISIPVIESKPFFESLTLSSGYRYSKYKVPGTATSAGNSFSTNTYKFEAEWAPVRDFKIRGSYNRAVRAPNITELFSATSVSLDGNSDPCAGAAPSATQAQCVLAGVSAAQYGKVRSNPASQYNGLQGGNTGLAPEKATTKSLGLVFTPTFLRGFSATLDYFDIKVKNDISAGIGADTILSQCVATGAAAFCSLIHRDGNGSLWLSNNGYVIDTNLNIGSVSTKGIDVAAAYTSRIGKYGTISVSLVGTYLDKLKTDTGVGVSYDCAGFYGLQCGTPNPEWRHKARLTYTMPSGPGVTFAWRYFSSVDLDKTSSDTALRQTNQATLPPQSLKIASQSYFDLSFTLPFEDKFTFRIGCNNIFDKSPPVVGSNALTSVTGNGNTFPQVYDALGRYLYAGVTLDF
ncbi:TonB-dependent receptor domain-containing protein [Sphingomonas sp. YR710]|uniref:TonB-dependent receptor domain-containing protein n=1 Tax=Sphingomonas sp. YR710 TaxID=1882773 RepID=UPI00210B46BD|nr:TonB-dependent receptor [Sphingomonas sp. YR710]